MVNATPLPVNTNATALQMAQTIFGSDIQITGASYDGANRASGIYTNGDSVSGDFLPSDTGVILSTGRASNLMNNSGQANQASNRSTDNNNNDGLADFDALAGRSTYDASVLEVDFIPPNNVNFMSIQFVFASDEYPEYSNSIYNDVVGVWVNGNLVPLEVGSGQTSVTNVNQNENLNLYNDNTQDQYNTEMDGFTVTMTLTIPVNAGAQNSIKIGIADASDGFYDSNLIIAGDSLQTDLVAISDTLQIGTNFSKSIDVLANDLEASNGAIFITEINGEDAIVGQPILLATGQTVTLLSDGTLEFSSTSDTGNVNFTYTVSNNSGTTDVGFVNVGTIPCFVAGTSIQTQNGEIAVEDLRVGDQVATKDDGAQEIRWVGQRTVPAEGNMAPIELTAGALGDHGTLRLSPQHRVLVADVRAQLCFGEDEVLVAAKDLVNDHSVRRVPGGEVTYVHLLFDDHQVIYAEGLATESFLPGPMTLGGFEDEVVEEITTLFPELDPDTGQGYGPAARPMLRGYETQVLMGQKRA